MEYLFDPILQFALLIIVLVAVHCAQPRHRAIRFTAHVIFFLALTTLLLMNGIAPYSAAVNSLDLWHRLFFGLAKAIWWLGGAMMLVSSVRLFLIFERRPREARLLQDLLAGIIYIGAALSVVAYVFSVPVGTLIATSGIFAVILGLALQSTLSDVFSGVALNLGRPYSVGHWIILENGVQGRVIETNWRATHLSNATNDLVVIPNSTLAKSQLVNLNSPDETHGITLSVSLAPTRPPAVMEQLLHTVLLASNHILRFPPPSVSIAGLGSQAIEFELAFRVTDVSQTPTAKNEIYDLIFRHAQAAGIPLASNSATAGYLCSAPALTSPPEHRAETSSRLITSLPLFATLTDKERDTLSNAATRRAYAKGTEILAQGERSPALMLIESGVVAIQRTEKDEDIELNRLSPGDFFGERGMLIGAEEPGRIITLTPVVTCQIDQDELCEILRNRPSLAEDIGLTLADRLEKEKQIRGVAETHAQRSQTLADRIRHLFQLQRQV